MYFWFEVIRFFSAIVSLKIQCLNGVCRAGNVYLHLNVTDGRGGIGLYQKVGAANAFIACDERAGA